MAHFSKTETEILQRLDGNCFNRTSVESGLHRGRGHTGKLRPYGNRERNALNQLLKKGLVRVVHQDRSQHYTRGFAEIHRSTVIERV